MGSNLQQKFRTTLASLGADAGVTQRRGLPLFEDATNLVAIDGRQAGEEHLLEPHAAALWLELETAAITDDVSVYILSAFRFRATMDGATAMSLGIGALIQALMQNASYN